ncbi:glycosyltransferase [Candidatus Saccharibacteria bacterium]|nr:glycosyltransferase [Candidatus Saccharibacteria bacterium]
MVSYEKMLEAIFYTLYVTFGLMLGVAGRQTLFAARHFNPPKHTHKTVDEKTLPTVTVCIPARNEVHAMNDCLASVLASDYPKMEVIVLDDSSVDDTSALVKSFAHEGVRFVAGAPLPKGWLGKNHALEGLLKEASGTYILFLDVDTRLAARALSNIIHYTQHEKASMVSIMPRREDGWRFSVLLSPLRYFWEVVFHRHLAPASASNAWLVSRKELNDYGGFTTLPLTVKPEAHLAAYFADHFRYRFLVSTKELGVSYQKKWRSQLMTSVRLLYPQLGSQWSIMTIVLLDLLLLLSPFVIALTTLNLGLGIHHVIISLGMIIGATLLYGLYLHRVWARGWWLGAILWPLVVLQEAVLVVASFVLYRQGRVTWKGRPLKSEVRS